VKNIPPVLKWMLGGLLVLEIVYVLTGVILVRSGRVGRWVNSRPEKRTIAFDGAWSFVPGVVRLSGVRVVNEGRGSQLEVVMDEARAFVKPVELLGKRVHIMGLEARGVEFRYRKRPRTMEEAEARARVAPPIEGIALEPYDGPAEEKKGGDGWTVAFTGAKVRDVREVWIDGLRILGPGDVAASVTVGAGRDKEVSIRSAEIRYPDAELQVEGTSVASDLDLGSRGTWTRFSPGRRRAGRSWS
jgi:hypothetical protein